MGWAGRRSWIDRRRPGDRRDGRSVFFRDTSARIPEGDINKETASSDITVAGAGIAGLMCALSAAESRVSVRLSEKAPTLSARGGDNTALNSRLHEKLAIRVDAGKVLHDPMKVHGGRIHHGIFLLWARNGARVMNRVLDLVEADGLRNYLVVPTRTDRETVVCWMVVDAGRPEDVPRMGLGFHRLFEATAAVRKEFQGKVAKGAVLHADSVEALAEKRPPTLSERPSNAATN